MSPGPAKPLRVLFLCTGNSARSQMAEALLNQKGGGRFVASSAGTKPAAQVNPLAVAALRQVGIDWHGRQPRSLDGLEKEPWDIVITVCDRAKESCPIFPGQPMLAHWGMEDPAEATGTDAQRLHAFTVARQLISRRLDLMLALPVEKLERLGAEKRIRAIGTES